LADRRDGKYPGKKRQRLASSIKNMKSMGMGCDVFIEPSSQHQTINEPPEAKYQTCSFATTNLA